MVGMPMQRDAKLGTRNLSDRGRIQGAQARFARQAAQDEADFDLDHSTVTPAATSAVRSRRRRTGWNVASRNIMRRSSSIRRMAGCRR